MIQHEKNTKNKFLFPYQHARFQTPFLSFFKCFFNNPTDKEFQPVAVKS